MVYLVKILAVAVLRDLGDILLNDKKLNLARAESCRRAGSIQLFVGLAGGEVEISN